MNARNRALVEGAAARIPASRHQDAVEDWNAILSALTVLEGLWPATHVRDDPSQPRFAPARELKFADPDLLRAVSGAARDLAL